MEFSVESYQSIFAAVTTEIVNIKKEEKKKGLNPFPRCGSGVEFHAAAFSANIISMS